MVERAAGRREATIAWFYILASRRNGTLYHGSTTDLSRRVWEHNNRLTPGFTSRYGVTMLVFYEHYDLLKDARAREYTVKHWRRTWKLQLIEAMNPTWADLYCELNGAPRPADATFPHNGPTVLFPDGEADPGPSPTE